MFKFVDLEARKETSRTSKSDLAFTSSQDMGDVRVLDQLVQSLWTTVKDFHNNINTVSRDQLVVAFSEITFRYMLGLAAENEAARDRVLGVLKVK